jgi:hypothetical protein
MIQVDTNGIASVRTDYRDTVYDALASANRIARKNYQATMQLQNLVVFALIMVGVLLIKGRK